jgi:hypothetical protein
MLGVSLALAFGPLNATFEEHGVLHGHRWRVRIVEAFLDPKNHRLDLRNGIPTIDGIRLIGFDTIDRARGVREIQHWRSGVAKDGDETWMEPLLVKSFTVWLDGKEIDLPKRMWRDCAQLDVVQDRSSGSKVELITPHFSAEYFAVKMPRNGSSLNVACWGSDGAGSYGVWWHIAKTGRVSRGFFDALSEDWFKHNGYQQN